MNMNNQTLPLTARTRQRTKREYIYLITIRKCQTNDFVTKCQLTCLLEKLLIKLGFRVDRITNIVYELAKYNQLHLHCIIYCNRSFRITHYNRMGQFFIHFKPVYDLGGAKGYLTKQVSCTARQDEVIIDNWYSHNYGFIKPKRMTA